MNKELSVLNKSLIDLRGESVRIKQEQDEKLEKIGQQKKVLQIWEDRLIEKEEKIASDMRTLLSAKNYKNV